MPETDRMVLRRASWPDVDDVVALTTDAEVMGFDDSPPLTPARVLAEEMPRLMAQQQAHRPAGVLGRPRARHRRLPGLVHDDAGRDEDCGDG